MHPKKGNIASRLIVGAFSGVVAFVLIALLEFLLVVRKGLNDYNMIFFNSDVLWIAASLFFVLGLILGPEKMTNLWGKIFGTNKK